jgi:molecular chaperone HtpG
MLKGKNITLDEYLEDFKVEEGKEKSIYFITAKSENEALINPYLEQFKEKNIDVLLLTDPIDEWIVGSLTEYKEAKLTSITASEIDLGNEKTPEEKEKNESTKKDFKDLLELIKNTI